MSVEKDSREKRKLHMITALDKLFEIYPRIASKRLAVAALCRQLDNGIDFDAIVKACYNYISYRDGEDHTYTFQLSSFIGKQKFLEFIDFDYARADIDEMVCKLMSAHPRPDSIARITTNLKAQLLAGVDFDVLLSSCENYCDYRSGEDHEYTFKLSNFIGCDDAYLDFMIE